MASFKIADSAFSVLQTDVFELAIDPDAFGLSPDEARVYALLCSHVRGTRLHVPADPSDCDALAGLLCDLSNSYDEQAERKVGEGVENARFCRNASRSLSTLSVKLAYKAAGG